MLHILLRAGLVPESTDKCMSKKTNEKKNKAFDSEVLIRLEQARGLNPSEGDFTDDENRNQAVSNIVTLLRLKPKKRQTARARNIRRNMSTDNDYMQPVISQEEHHYEEAGPPSKANRESGSLVSWLTSTLSRRRSKEAAPPRP